MIFDNTPCILGEGALWHPLRQSFFWFDIKGMAMFERSFEQNSSQRWDFDEHVSAAGWLDENSLLIASETSLSRFDITSHHRTVITALEADNALTRSNDGRADSHGGFWIGTMGKDAQPGAGAIYRFYQGELRKIIANISISNSICFSPCGSIAYYADTPTKKIMKAALDEKGWPIQEWELFADVAPFNPDGSVVDSTGHLWNAQWGANRVARYNSEGIFVESVKFPASQISCPAFGGPEMNMLFATSARDGLPSLDGNLDGQTFVEKVNVQGQKEHQVIL